MKYLYIQTNKDWNTENKFKYGYTENPKNRLTSEQHSHKSSYLSLYECIETENYIYRDSYKEYDKIISRLHNTDDNDINQEALENGINLYKLIEIKKYLIYEKGGGTEFIRSIEAIELLDDIFINVFKDIGINTRKLSKDEINDINDFNDKNNKKIKDIIISKKDNKIKLRDYQIDIIQNGFNIIYKNNKFYLELATGAGKSTIIYYILNNIILHNKDIYYTIIIFTPRINISNQNINDKYIKILKKSFNIYNNKKIRNIKNFNNNSYNIICCCIQSFQFIYHKIIIKFDIKNIIIWFDEAHYTIENWIKNSNHYKLFYLTDNERIIYRLFTSASPNKDVVKNNINVFGELYSPISVRNLIKDKWLSPIKPLIMDFNEIIIDENNDDDMNDDINIDNIYTNSNKYYYYTNTILNTFQIKIKRIGLNFHNSCKNAIFAFFSHYNKFINNKTNIKPYLLISDEIKNKKVLDLLDINYKYLLNFEDFHNENNNAIAYIVNMYNMGYDNPKIDFLSFGDPKLSNKDIIQSIGRGIRTDGLGLEGRNLNKINDIIIPIYNNSEETDKYIKFTKIKEILQYLIYDIGLDIKDIKIYNNSSINNSSISYNDCYCNDELEESKIIANIIKWDIEPTAEKWNMKRIMTHLMNNKIHNYNDYLEYISLEENKELNLPLDLFKTHPNFNFNDTYKLSPYYNRDECIEAIKKYKNDFIDNDDIDKNDNNDIIKFLNQIDKKIPNCILWYYYGGLKNDFILFI
jgi:superfamily II DNA or RNA helicase